MDLAIVSIVLTVIGLGTQYLLFIGKLNERVAKLETKTDVFWHTVEQTMADTLKQPIHLEKDALLDKLKSRTLTVGEAKCLQRHLWEDMKANHNSLATLMILARVNQLIAISSKLKEEDKVRW